jgi:erythrin-vacuolar iron transport family protein
VRTFKSLNEQEILALAISLEEEDAHFYDDMAARLQDTYPATAKLLQQMRVEEDGHRHRLIEQYRKQFGEHIPLIRRQDVKGFVERRPIWLMRPLGLNGVRKQIAQMELETKRFYSKAIQQTTNAGIRQLLGDLAEEERKHQALAGELEEQRRASGADESEALAQRRLFVLQVIQPGLAGLMDGSVSTLAPLFAAAFATRNPHETFLVGLAASLGAGISMGFAEALSDDGSLTGLGGLGHTLPYLIPAFGTATALAIAVVAVELIAIAYIRHHYMETPLTSAVFQVVVGGVLVFVTGILIGSS